MKYQDGRRVRVGDRVSLWHHQTGVVVCSIDTGEFSREFPKEHWAYLKSGIVVKSDSGELFHYDQPDEDLELIRANAAP